MSRTSRRTNADGLSTRWFCEGDVMNIRRGQALSDTEYVEDDVRPWAYVKILIKGKTWAKQKALYHSDNVSTIKNAPKWYRKWLNRKLRTKQKTYLNKHIQYDEFDDYAEPTFVKDAGWYW